VTRALWIDLRRSSAVGIALLIVGLGVTLLYTMVDGGWWIGRWTGFAVQVRSLLDLLWPITLASGAWQVGRDRRGRVGELFSSTSRPIWQRVAPSAVALLVTVSAAYLVLVIAGVPKMLSAARYFNPAVIAIVAVGLVALLAAALLGMAVGRLLPSPFTAPALAVAGFGVMIVPNLLSTLVERTRPAFELLSPSLTSPSSDFVIVSSRVTAAQGIWLLALAVTGFLLLAGAGRRQRLIALLPVALGAAIVIPMLPHGTWFKAVYVADAGSRELVCADGAPRVCVRQVHAALLPEVVGPARQALQRLSVLPDPPIAVVERAYASGEPQVASDPSTVSFDASMDAQGRLSDPAGLEVELLDVGFSSNCPHQGYDPHDLAARRAAAYLLIGRPPVPSEDPRADPLIADAYRTVSALPEKARLQRVIATRTAFRTCTGDPYAALTEGGK
jgi:hypothetical protein